MAVVEDGAVATYAELALKVAAARLGRAPRLVLLKGTSSAAWTD